MKKLVILITVFFNSFLSFAQFNSFKGPELDQLKKNKEAIQLGKVGVNFYTITRCTEGKGLKFYLEKYDSKTLAFVERKEFTVNPSDKKIGILWAKIIKSKVLILYQDIDKSAPTTVVYGGVARNWEYYIAGQYISLDGKPIEEPVRLAKFDSYVQLSEDSSCFIFNKIEYEKGTPKNLNLKIVKTNNLRSSADHTISLINTSKNIISVPSNVQMSKNQIVYYVAQNFKLNNTKEFYYSVNGYDPKKKQTNEINLDTKGQTFFNVDYIIKDNLLTLAGWCYKNEKELVHIKGMYTFKPQDEDVQGMFTAKIDLNSQKLTFQSYNKSIKYRTELCCGAAEEKEKMDFYPLDVESIHLNSDNSFYVVSQATTYDVLNPKETFAEYNYWSYDIVVCKFNSVGDIMWTKNIPNNANNYGRRITCDYTPIYCNNKVYLLRHENKSNWQNYYVAKSIKSKDLKMHGGERGGIFIIDEFDDAGELKTSEGYPYEEKSVFTKMIFGDWTGPTFSIGQPFLYQDNNEVVLYADLDDKYQFFKLIFN